VAPAPVSAPLPISTFAGVLVEPHATTTSVVARADSNSRPVDMNERIDSLLQVDTDPPNVTITLGAAD